MSKPISKLWLLGPPAAILLSVLVYYAMFASVRRWTDARFPWVAENIGSHLPELIDESSGAADPRDAVTIPDGGEAMEMPASPASTPAPPSFVAADGTVDVKGLAADRASWPKSVVIKNAMEFPAVVDGKVVGKLRVPSGTTATLVSIQGGKLGVEYRGGGAWLAVEDTDLAQQLRR